eukprot:CAMPEP_0185848872 /NCGR_PEP_ID=MMETSP1354-20130828/3590_1 /TAXON_ID=708628 /ORGANISM="Erythrolobus madagascarensis, Strain CCMP3276" /LENGTH=324 /DNA_ID=CAMNT_0028549329 /DNA_START=91 /DNA_END=1065 /DNA_ORIENTATION=-
MIKARVKGTLRASVCFALPFSASSKPGGGVSRRQVLAVLNPARLLAFTASLSLFLPRFVTKPATATSTNPSNHSPFCAQPARSLRTAPVMAWRSHGNSNSDLVGALRRNGILSSPGAIAAMTAVDRAKYVLPEFSSEAYQDSPQPIGFNATISAPHMHAMCLDLLRTHIERPGSSSLDVGSGSGYLAACMARMASAYGGRVVGVEHIDGLTSMAKKNVRSDPAVADLLGDGADATLQLVTADGRKGFAASAPYDAIHVGAAADGVPPELLEQLKAGGRMVIPVGKPNRAQELVQVDKDENGRVSMKPITGVRYVPLTDQAAQWP